MVRSRTEMLAVYESLRRLTMWCPRKPQPPITRTFPRGLVFAVEIGAIAGYSGGIDGVVGEERRLRWSW